MPQAPNVEGLPLLLQVIATVAFAIGTLWIARSGYRPKPKLPAEGTASVIGASFADMGAIRHLSDVCVELTVRVEKLDDSVGELTHWIREGNEQSKASYEALAEMRKEREIERAVAAAVEAERERRTKR